MSLKVTVKSIRTLRVLFLLISLSAFLMISLGSCGTREADRKTPQIVNGSINLSGFTFNDRATVSLGGNWFFWPDVFLSPSEVRAQIAQGYRATQAVPGIWSSTGLTGSVSKLSKGGTLALKLTMPPDRRDWAIRLPNANSACELYIDGRYAASIGTVGSTPHTSVPNNGLRIVNFTADSNTVLLVLRVSNFHTPYTGTWDSPTIGAPEAIETRHDMALILTALISGALIFMGLYHLSLHLFRRKDSNSLIFGIVCLMLAARNLIMGERILNALFPRTALGWEIAFNVEHLSIHMALPLLALFFRQLFPRQIRKNAVLTVIAISMAWAALELFTPALFHHRFLSLFEYFVLATGIYLLVAIMRALIRGEAGAGLVIAGFAVLLLSVLNDVLLSRGLIHSYYMTSIGMFFFLFIQSILLSVKFSQLFSIVERFTRELQTLNQSLERFIPHEVLNFLGKRSIVDIDLGDFSEEMMSVFFLDIRDFTALSERMTPNETFLFINTFLERFGPIVRNHGGFIDKYLGDGFMALFPNDADSALDAALEMRRALLVFNAERRNAGLPIRIGIGIHRGPLMLGTIGENQRMDSTVISDTVNTASRLEQLTKTHKRDILVSSELVKGLRENGRFSLTRIGHEQVKGKKQTIEVYALEGAAGDQYLWRAAPSSGRITL